MNPCPFCGAPAAITSDDDGEGNHVVWTVACTRAETEECPVIVLSVSDDKETAVARWNARASDAEHARLRDAATRLPVAQQKCRDLARMVADENDARVRAEDDVAFVREKLAASATEIDTLTTRASQTRTLLEQIDAAVRDGLQSWPRIMDRVEFVRSCVRLHREDAANGVPFRSHGTEP